MDERASPAVGDSLLSDILGSPDRDHCPGSLPVVSLHDDDERAFQEAVRERARSIVTLTRRGVDHGSWAELRAVDLLADFHRAAPELGAFAGRWHEARPIYLRGVIDTVAGERLELSAARELFERLGERGGLRSWVEQNGARLDAAWTRSSARMDELADPERDIERLEWRHVARGGARATTDLWLKSAWLSTHPDDRSLRLRVSFGREGRDDASADALRHALLAPLAAAFLPGAAEVLAHEGLRAILADLCGGPVFTSQHIAYWNAPEGGALFHHDAFGNPEPSGQRGVAFVQLAGRTAWLALSIADLAERVVEFGDYLAAGELAWIAHALFGGRGSARFAAFRRRLEDGDALLRELALPGQGALGPLVNRGPEFTTFLVDCGHAAIVAPGDVVLLPNHGTARTAMHSVFAVDEGDHEPSYALSLALRDDLTASR